MFLKISCKCDRVLHQPYLFGGIERNLQNYFVKLKFEIDREAVLQRRKNTILRSLVRVDLLDRLTN